MRGAGKRLEARRAAASAAGGLTGWKRLFAFGRQLAADGMNAHRVQLNGNQAWVGWPKTPFRLAHASSTR
jgi:hypothetical protein